MSKPDEFPDSIKWTDLSGELPASRDESENVEGLVADEFWTTEPGAIWKRERVELPVLWNSLSSDSAKRILDMVEREQDHEAKTLKREWYIWGAGIIIVLAALALIVVLSIPLITVIAHESSSSAVWTGLGGFTTGVGFAAATIQLWMIRKSKPETSARRQNDEASSHSEQAADE